jgi:DNA-binding XRE family transcriptional regulator
MTAEQLRAARAFLRWEQSMLAEKAGVSVETVKRLEKMDGPLLTVRAATVVAIQAAFEREGMELTNGGEPGVRLRKSPAAQTRDNPKGRAKAADMAGEQIDKLANPAMPEEERHARKGRLIKGPKEFRDMRRDRAAKPKS